MREIIQITLEDELQTEALELIMRGKRAFIYEREGKLSIYDGASVTAYQAERQGWEYVGETFNGIDFLKK